jgi:Na+/H+ antiporter NhaC
MENEEEGKHPIKISRYAIIGLVVLVVGIILLGTLFGPWFGFTNQAALNLF